jgi:hypothetical protein
MRGSFKMKKTAIVLGLISLLLLPSGLSGENRPYSEKEVGIRLQAPAKEMAGEVEYKISQALIRYHCTGYRLNNLYVMKKEEKNTFFVETLLPTGYAVYNAVNDDVQEIGLSSDYPYEASELRKVIQRSEEKKVGAKNFYSSTSPSYQIVSADKEVLYSWYFKNNTYAFPYCGTNGTRCGYIALSLMLFYNDAFKSHGYLTDYAAANYITKAVGTYGTSVQYVTDAFYDDAFGLNALGPCNASDIYNALTNYISFKGMSYDIYYYQNFLGNVADCIKDGCPALLFGSLPYGTTNIDHIALVYGTYNDGKLLCHYGINGLSQVIISKPGIFDSHGVVSLYNKSPHYHWGYFQTDAGVDYCSCGANV